MRALLTRDEVIEYTRCKNARQLWREIKAGVWPEPLINSRPPRWSKAALDIAAGIQPPSENDGEAKALKALNERYG